MEGLGGGEERRKECNFVLIKNKIKNVIIAKITKYIKMW